MALPCRIADQPPIITNATPASHSACYVDVGIHAVRRRTAPRARSAAWEAANNRCARSPGVNRNCSISSVRSTPNACAAWVRPPGAGFRNLSSARRSSSSVNGLSSATTRVYRRGLTRSATLGGLDGGGAAGGDVARRQRHNDKGRADGDVSPGRPRLLRNLFHGTCQPIAHRFIQKHAHLFRRLFGETLLLLSQLGLLFSELGLLFP
jgi:hypothetical protein